LLIFYTKIAKKTRPHEKFCVDFIYFYMTGSSPKMLLSKKFKIVQ